MERDLPKKFDGGALLGSAPLTLRKRLRFRTRSLRNLLWMGHCAPTVMKSFLDLSGSGEEWPVKLAAGLPGGIGDTGYECGGITAPLIFFGLKYGLDEKHDGLPIIFDKGHGHVHGFLDRNGTPLCREIRGDNYRLTHCIRAVCTAPEIAKAASSDDGWSSIAGDERQSYGRLYSYFEARNFHCAHHVLQRLAPAVPLSQDILHATSGFLGGTLFLGMTCSAYAAGVMSLGFSMDEFENSLARVTRMIVLMKTGRNAFADHINKFNRIMNQGKALAGWFKEEFGSTQCRTITGCDFSSVADVESFGQNDSIARCRAVAEEVADKVRRLAQN